MDAAKEIARAIADKKGYGYEEELALIDLIIPYTRSLETIGATLKNSADKYKQLYETLIQNDEVKIAPPLDVTDFKKEDIPEITAVELKPVTLWAAKIAYPSGICLRVNGASYYGECGDYIVFSSSGKYICSADAFTMAYREVNYRDSNSYENTEAI